MDTTLLTVLRSDFFRSVRCQACGDTQKPASHLCSGIHDYVAPRSLNSLIILWLASCLTLYVNRTQDLPRYLSLGLSLSHYYQIL